MSPSNNNRRNSFHGMPKINMADLEIPSFKNYRDNKSPDSSASSIHPFSNREFNQPNPPNTPEPEQKSFHQDYQNFYQQPPPPNPTTHFLDRVIQLPAYNPTPFGRRVIKIKPTKKDLFFDGTNMDILDFIAELENAAVQDGAQAEDIATQISSFIRDQNLLKEIRDMTGKINNDWELLKYQMVQRWGKMMPLMKYTRESLDNLIYKARTEGGIKTLKAFQDFSTKLDTIVNYLVRCRHMASVEEIRHSVLNCLTPELRLSVNKELIRDNQMNLAIDGSYLLPPYQVIIKYIHKELKTLSILQMEEEAFSKEVQEKNVSQRSAVNKAPSPEKAIEEITKTLASWNVQKKPSTFYQSSHVPYTPAQNTRPPESFFCHYCHLKGHSTGRCNLANHDEIEGLIKREGGQIKLPDGSVVPFERSRPFKTAVDQYYAKSSQPGIIKIPPGSELKKEEKVPEAQTSFGKLEELEFEDSTNYESDAAKRTRKGEEKEESEKSGGRNSPYKRVRKENDQVMDVDDEAERIMEIARKNYPDPEPTNTAPEDPSKKVQFKDSEEVIKNPKEKAPKKTMLERPLAKEFPDTEEKVVNRMLMDGRIELTYGEVFAISHGAIEVFKKRTNPRRIPINSTEMDMAKSVNTAGANSDSEDEEEENSKTHPAHYACPLGYININISGKQLKALLDNGSMVNVLSRGLACGMGLIVTEKRMNLKGIGGHKNEIIGIAENVPVKVGSITKPVHFWISSGDVQPILGKPFLVSASATIKFQKEGAESLSIKDKDRTYLVPILIPKNQKWETTFPVNSSSTSSHFLASGTFRK
jgi:hypothetical protein